MRDQRETAGAGERHEADPSLIASAFESVDYGLMVFDDAGIVRSANTAARSAFGATAAEMVGRPITAVLPELSRAGYAAFLERHRRTGADQAGIGAGFEIDGVRRDGTTFPVHVDLRGFAHRGTTYYLCACRQAAAPQDHGDLIAHLSRHDRATGCLNRFGLEDYLDQIIEWRPDRSLAIVYLSLTGLARGGGPFPRPIDALLVAHAVARLRDALSDHDRLARLDRYEFAAVVGLDEEAPSNDLSVARVSKALVTCLQAPLEAALWSVPTRASIGISLYPDHGRTPETLVDRAEAAMHRARRAQSSEAQLFSLEDQRYDEDQIEYLDRLRAAVDRREFALHYQPQFDLRTRTTTGIEALLRWNHPEQGTISPDEFLPLLTACGLMPTVTRWVLHEAVAANVRLIRDGILDVPVGVNVGPEEFEDPGFADVVREVLAEHALPPERLEVEVTEATAITDPGRVTANADALRALGVGVAVDDFGTGFSSLKRLRLTEFSKLKIDRAFIAALPGTDSDQTVITTLLDLADGLRMDAVAEGIETEEQLDKLRRLGCRFGQGFWYARPMPESDLRTWARRTR